MLTIPGPGSWVRYFLINDFLKPTKKNNRNYILPYLLSDAVISILYPFSLPAQLKVEDQAHWRWSCTGHQNCKERHQHWTPRSPWPSLEKWSMCGCILMHCQTYVFVCLCVCVCLFVCVCVCVSVFPRTILLPLPHRRLTRNEMTHYQIWKRQGELFLWSRTAHVHPVPSSSYRTISQYYGSIAMHLP